TIGTRTIRRGVRRMGPTRPPTSWGPMRPYPWELSTVYGSDTNTPRPSHQAQVPESTREQPQEISARRLSPVRPASTLRLVSKARTSNSPNRFPRRAMELDRAMEMATYRLYRSSAPMVCPPDSPSRVAWVTTSSFNQVNRIKEE